MRPRGRVVHGRPVRLLCAAVVATGGAVCLGIALGFVAAEQEAAGWPVTPGVVVAQDTHPVNVPGPRRRGPGYRVSVRYRYEVNGRAYESDRYNASGGDVDKATADDVQDRYRPGAACDVYYDPDDPGRAYLVVGTGPTGWVLIWSLTVAGVLQLAVAGWGVWAGRPAEGAG
ncbi:MAG: DUF3592 domain-containing protein [Gemmataceae bacterium]